MVSSPLTCTSTVPATLCHVALSAFPRPVYLHLEADPVSTVCSSRSCAGCFLFARGIRLQHSPRHRPPDHPTPPLRGYRARRHDGGPRCCCRRSTTRRRARRMALLPLEHAPRTLGRQPRRAGLPRVSHAQKHELLASWAMFSAPCGYSRSSLLFCTPVPRRVTPSSLPTPTACPPALRRQVRFYQRLLRQGLPASFWFGAFFDPCAFTAALLRAYARRHGVPLERLRLAATATEFTTPAQVLAPPSAGCCLSPPHGCPLGRE